MIITDFHAFARSDIDYNDNEYFYIVAGLPCGFRFALQGTNFGDDGERAARFADKINKAGRIDTAHWSEIDPCYGSEAHQQIGDFHLMSEGEIEYGRKMGYWL